MGKVDGLAEDTLRFREINAAPGFDPILDVVDAFLSFRRGKVVRDRDSFESERPAFRAKPRTCHGYARTQSSKGTITPA